MSDDRNLFDPPDDEDDDEHEAVFDAEEARRRAEEGQARAARHREELQASFLAAIELAAWRNDQLSTDEVWFERGSIPDLHGQASGIGPAMVKAAKMGWMKDTGTFKRSARPEMHQQPVRVYDSLLYGRQWGSWREDAAPQ